MRTRAIILMLAASSVAMAGSFRKAEKEVNYDNRPQGSEWLGDWRQKLTADDSVRLWAEAARQRLGVTEAKAAPKPPATSTASAPATQASSSSSR